VTIKLTLENERLNILQGYNILDTASEEEYDQLTELASHLCGTAIAFISLIDEDRHWFKSHYGLCISEIPRDCHFLEQAFYHKNVFEVKDSRQSELFQNSPLVLGKTNIIYFAGAPLILPTGEHIGTLGVIDDKPSQLTDSQNKHLMSLANQVINLLELRKVKSEQKNILKYASILSDNFEQKNNQLQHVIYAVSHDLKAPLVTISGFSKTLEKELSVHCSEKQIHRFNRINENIAQMVGLLSDLTTLSRVMNHTISIEALDADFIIKELWDSLSHLCIGITIDFVVQPLVGSIYADKTLFSLCVLNLLEHAIHYRDPSRPLHIYIQAIKNDSHTAITFSDNGLGIKLENQERIFHLFEQVEQVKGKSIGLCLVKTAIEKLHGKIQLQSTYGEGSHFELYFPNNNV
jgi:signal transduction histidine kinase|tara:strand:+ start:2353 stop:3570 length:1218 start_codon:yes stop_codon:yes gene_type:complete